MRKFKRSLVPYAKWDFSGMLREFRMRIVCLEKIQVVCFCITNAFFSNFRKSLKNSRRKDGNMPQFLRPNSTTKKGRLISSGVGDGTERWLQREERKPKCPCLLCVFSSLKTRWDLQLWKCNHIFFIDCKDQNTKKAWPINWVANQSRGKIYKGLMKIKECVKRPKAPREACNK